MKVHALEDLTNEKFKKVEEILSTTTEKTVAEVERLREFIQEKEAKADKQAKDLRIEMRRLQDSLHEWSSHTLFFRMLFDLSLNKRVTVDERFVERVLHEKVSNNCIYAVNLTPDGKVVVDANLRACILDMSNFEIVNRLEPTGQQLVTVKFQGEKMITHYYSMYNISYQASGKYYQLANTDTNNWQYCMCIPDDSHIVQGSHGGLIYVFQTQQVNYFIQKQCTPLPGGYAIKQIIKLEEENKYAVGTWGNGLHVIDIDLVKYDVTRDGHFFLQGKYVTDVVEVAPNVLLVASYSDCSYYLVNLATKEESFLAKGFSPYSLGLCMFPEFDYEEFPFVLAKEDDWICAINVKAGFIYRLVHCSTHTQNYLN